MEHEQARLFYWKYKESYIQIRFLTNNQIDFLLKKYIIDNKRYGTFLGKQWRTILESEKSFRKQFELADKVFFNLLLKRSDVNSKRNILYLLNPDLSVKRRIKLAEELTLKCKETNVVEEV